METKNTIEMMFTVEETNQFRAKLREAGSLIGQRVVCVIADNLDLGYKDAVANGENRLLYPIKKLTTETVDIFQAVPVKAADGDIYMQFNGRPELKFPIKGAAPKVERCTEQDIQDAIREYNANKTIHFFKDVALVNKVVTEENDKNIKKLEKMANDFLLQATALRTINSTENASTEAYLKSLGE